MSKIFSRITTALKPQQVNKESRPSGSSLTLNVGRALTFNARVDSEDAHLQKMNSETFLIAHVPLHKEESVRDNSLRLQRFVFVGTHGQVRAMESSSEDLKMVDVWTRKLKGIHAVHILLDENRMRLYVATSVRVYCLHALTGDTDWKTLPHNSIHSSDTTTLLLTNDKSVLLYASAGYVAALDPANGSPVWTHRVATKSAHACITLCEDKGTIFYGTADVVGAIQQSSGKEVWNYKFSSVSPVSIVKCTVKSEDILAKEFLFVGKSGSIIALNSRTGAKLKELELKESDKQPVTLAIDNNQNLLYAASRGAIRCFRTDRMDVVWRSYLPGMGCSKGHSLLLAEDNIILGMAGKICALHANTGKTVWTTTYSKRTGFITVGTYSPQHILIGGIGYVAAVDKNKGDIVARYELRGMSNHSVTLSNVRFNTDFNSTTLPQHGWSEKK